MKRAVLILLITVAGLALVALIGFGFYQVSVRGVARHELTDAERRLIVTVASLAQFGVQRDVCHACESLIAKRNFDGSIEIEYDYDSELGPEGTEYLSFSSEAQIDASVRNAHESFNGQVAAYKIGIAGIANREIREQPEKLKIGDESYWATVYTKNKELGTVVVVRNKRVTHSLLIFGMFFGSAGSLDTLLRPVIDESSQMGNQK